MSKDNYQTALQEVPLVTSKVLRQRDWTDEELEALGFKFYEPRKELVMARRLPESEAPLRILTSNGDELTAEAGDMICYKPDEHFRGFLGAYEQWPVEYEVFQRTYLPWDEDNWRRTAAVHRLTDLGYQPYFKAAGIWAKELKHDINLQSLEHEKPVRIKAGQVVAIGVDGEPYSMDLDTFRRRYVLPMNERIKVWIDRVIEALPI